MGSGHPGARELMEPRPGTRAQSPELLACQPWQQVLSWIKRPQCRLPGQTEQPSCPWGAVSLWIWFLL